MLECQATMTRFSPVGGGQEQAPCPPQDGKRSAKARTNLCHSLSMVARSDVGVVRIRNEDAVFADAALGLAILADGMGGYRAGDVASGMAVSRLAEDLGRLIALEQSRLRDSSLVGQHLVDEIGAANEAIYNASQSVENYAGMGTTVVAAWFYDNRLSVAHVGDSRLYRLRGDRFEQLTHDHSLLQEQLDQGVIRPEEARYASHKNLVTRALGVDSAVAVDVRDYDVRLGDIIMLCSDGLTDMLDDDEIASTLHALRDNLPLAAEHLVQQANDHGGRDNVSVILVKVEGDFAVTRGWWQRLLSRLK